MIQFIFTLLVFIAPLSSHCYQPVKLDHPRDTMSTFMKAMDDYKKGLNTGDNELLRRIDDAVRTLNLQDIPFLARKEKGRQTAILLKEFLDRVIVIRFELIPEEPKENYWRLKDTEVVVRKVKDGDREGLWLFSKDTVERSSEFYDAVKHQPYLKGTTEGAGYRVAFADQAIPEWARKNFLGLAKWKWIGLFLAILFGLVLKVLSQFIISHAKGLVGNKENSVRRQVLLAIERPVGLLVAAGFWFFAIQLLRFDGLLLTSLSVLVQIIFSIGLVWAAYRLTDIATEYMRRWAAQSESELDDQLVPLISKSLRVFVLVVGSLFAIQNLGFNVMSLIAGLGLGGLAFALAAKDTAANFFGSIMIFLDRPFKVGDWIICDSAEGTVEEIGFRSTRVRTFYNSLVSIPNSTLVNTNIDNMGERQFRRAKALIGVTYDTPPQKLESFINGIKSIISEHPITRKDYYHVVFTEYADFSLNILVYYFFKTDDWAEELRGKQEVNFEILKLADKLGVSFAFPTQTLHVDSLPEEKPKLSGQPAL